ncbi:hypothetical protein AAGS20_000398 [Yersinia enterocolitica]|nr:hypothetical protein [Yersinia enterocolitica]HEI6939025.1 hypothetical protein [Yersinia enterocolitica]
MTYIWTGKRWAYLAVVLDLFARKPVGLRTLNLLLKHFKWLGGDGDGAGDDVPQRPR